MSVRLPVAFAPRVVAGGSDTGTVPPADAQLSRVAPASLALSNLRAVVIVIVVGFHASLAYLRFLGPSPFPFDGPTFEWRAFPIVDSHRWLGFDVFCAWQDVYLMAFMFFLSALFTWPSLNRKGTGKFLRERFLRLGVPFVFAVLVVVPIALYPVYAVSAAGPSVADFARHYVALPFLPNGPEWFLWQLLALTIVAALLHRFAPAPVIALARCLSGPGAGPARCFAALTIAAVVAYVPLALAFTPFAWIEHGPLGLQFSRPLLYTVFYFAGLGVGAFGLENGLLRPDGPLARRWYLWSGAALVSFLAWMGLMSLTMDGAKTTSLALRAVVDSSFALACVSGCFCVTAACLRFGTTRSRVLTSLAANAFAIYLLHYVFVVWLQYALLSVALFALAKGVIVLAASLALAWASASVLRRLPFGPLLIGEDARPAAHRPAAAPSGHFALVRRYRRVPAPGLARR